MLIGDDLQNALEVVISTRNGIRSINFTLLGVKAVIDMAEKSAGWFKLCDIKDRLPLSCNLMHIQRVKDGDLQPPSSTPDRTVKVRRIKEPEVIQEPHVHLPTIRTDLKEGSDPKVHSVSEEKKHLALTPLPQKEIGLKIGPDIGSLTINCTINSPYFGKEWVDHFKPVWEAALKAYPVLAMTEGVGPRVREEVHIPVTDSEHPVFTPSYRSALAETDFIRKKVSELLTKGIIKRTRSN